MRTRFTWMVAVLALVSIAFIMACSTKYSSSSNGLVVVASRDSKVMQTFSLDLSNGHVAQINNVNGPVTPGLPSSVLLDRGGAFAYVLLHEDPTLPAGSGNLTGVAAYQVASDGKLALGGTVSLNNANVTVQVNGQNVSESVPVFPVAMAMDSAGKFLFVADSATSDNSGNPVPGAVSVLAIGSSGSLTEVSGSPGSPFVLPVGGTNLVPPPPCTVLSQCPSASALAGTSTVFPAQFAPCSGLTSPSTENLYVADSTDNVVVNYSVGSSGALTLVPVAAVTTGTLPSGVAVDPCNRFVYVANANSNNVSAFTICSVVSQNCPMADYSLQPVSGSPYAVGDLPGPLTTDAYANFLYVVNTGGSTISAFRMSSATGTLTAVSPASVATAAAPNSIVVRSDDSWVFVANLNSANVSQYALTPATGALTPQSPFATLNFPSGVAVK